MKSFVQVALLSCALSACMLEANDQSETAGNALSFEVKLSHDGTLKDLHNLKDSYRLPELKEASLVGVVQNLSPQKQTFPCRYLQSQGVPSIYFSDSSDYKFAGHVGPADPSLKSDLQVLDAGSACITAGPFAYSFLKDLLEQAATDRIAVGIDVSFPADPIFGQVAGAKRIIRFDLTK